MLLASAVVVWEWLNEHGRWRPYSPAVSHQIEAAIRSSDPRGGSVVLGQVDSRLSPYIIDLQSMHQFRQDTGTIRPVRRTFYDPVSAPGQGWQWEWENDAGTWTPYDMEVAIAIESAHSRQQTCLDLTPLGFCYLIDFKNMTQVNRQSQRCRRIQRRADLAYPLVSGPLPVPKGGAVGGGLPVLGLGQPCSCQQCMLVLSVKTGAGGPGGPGGGAAAIQTLNRRALTMQRPKISRAPSARLSRPPWGGACSRAPPTTRRCRTAWPSPRTRRRHGGTPSCSPSRWPPSPPAPPPWVSRSSLAGLSRPALQRIAMAQSRALIASGVPTVPVKNLNGSSPVHPALAGMTGILMSAAALPVCLTRPPKLVLHPPPISKSDIKPVPGFNHSCRKTTKKQVRKGKTPEEVVKKYLQKVKSPPEEDCTICMEPLGGPSGYKGPGVGPVSKAESVGRLTQCGHQYHFQCLVAMYNNGNKDGSLQCPTCKTIYGVKTGNQPAGKMEYHVIPHSLPGHPDCKSIRIIYNIPPGIQGPEHPNPGKPFTARGFPRHCYLPDSEKGRKVLRLLLVAWDRRLIFSVGTSSTTGESDTVIWNEVHHKTEFGSNLTGHGFPDPGHLDNVLEELRAQGITEEDALVEK
uniref:E3 ubiquitin-protein ligase n=1 Tax=Poecilia formosa TaxID=48698 RepID=A0A087Y8W0_POEFO